MEEIWLLADFCARQLSLFALSSVPQSQKILGKVVALLPRIFSKLQKVFALRYDLVLDIDDNDDSVDDDDDNEVSISRDVGGIKLGCTLILLREDPVQNRRSLHLTTSSA